MVDKGMPVIVRKDITFIVRKPDRVKNIAARFHISGKLITLLNPPIHKRQTMYAGKQLIVPVWLKRKTTAQDESEFDLADYSLNTDSLDMYIREDFVCMADIEADTIRRIAIGKEMRRIDRKIEAVNLVLDSIEEDGMRNFSNREIRKMPMDRARRVGKFNIGAQIDTLKQQRQKLVEEKAKIDIRVADYDYLVENASYMASHPDTDSGKVINIQDWGADPDKVVTLTGKNKK